MEKKPQENFWPRLSYQQEQQGIETGGGGECINTGTRRYNICNVKMNSTEHNLRKTPCEILLEMRNSSHTMLGCFGTEFDFSNASCGHFSYM